MNEDRVLINADTLKIYQYHTDTEPVRYAIQRNNDDGSPRSRITLSRAEMQDMIKAYYPMWDSVQRDKATLLRTAGSWNPVDSLVMASYIIGELTFDKDYRIQTEAHLRAAFTDALPVPTANADELQDYCDRIKTVLDISPEDETTRSLKVILSVCQERLQQL